MNAIFVSVMALFLSQHAGHVPYCATANTMQAFVCNDNQGHNMNCWVPPDSKSFTCK